METLFGKGKFKTTPIASIFLFEIFNYMLSLKDKKQILIQSFNKEMQTSTYKASMRGIFEDNIKQYEFAGNKFLNSEQKIWNQYLLAV